MASSVLTDVGFYIAEYNFSAEMNEVSLTQDIEAPDATSFATNGTRSYTAGLAGVSGTHHGWWDNDNTTKLSGGGQFFTNVGVQLAGLHTLMPEGGLEDEVAYMFNATQTRYSPNGSLGDIFGFDLEFMPRGDLLRGTTLTDSEVSRSATETGTERQLGASTGLTVYSGIHCTEFTGTTLDVTIESDVVGFAGPTTRITHTQLTDVGSELSTFTAGTTDDYWRMVGTFVGTSFTLACVVAIQA